MARIIDHKLVKKPTLSAKKSINETEMQEDVEDAFE